jgi:predicted kinase
MIVLMAGLPGTGKTTLARELATRTAGAILNKDEIRAVLFAQADIEYSTEQDDFCLGVMLDAAAYLLQRSPERFVYLDGRPFSRAYQIEQALQAAARLRQPWRILECVCSEQIAKGRLAGVIEHLAANRDFALYSQIKTNFEQIPPPKTVIDTGQPLEICIQQALAALGD